MKITLNNLKSAVVLALCIRAMTCPAANRWAVLTDDDASMASAVEFTADGTGLVLLRDGGTRTPVPLRSVACLLHRVAAPASRPDETQARRCFYAERPSGERILAETMELSAGKLSLGNSRWGRVECAATSVWRMVASDTRLPPAPPDFTGVRYVNGDSVPGAIASLSDTAVLVDMPGIGKVPVDDLTAVSEIVLCPAGPRPPRNRAPEFLLRSGELLYGYPTGGSDWFLKVRTAWAAEPLTIPLEMLSSAAFLEGRILLSAAAKSETTGSFLGYQRPTVRDRALTGGVLSVDGFTAARGLALYAGNRVDFALPSVPGGTIMIAWAGIDDAIPPRMGSAELKIVVDGQVAQAIRLEAGGALAPVRVELPPTAAALSIRADYGTNGPAGGHADIIYPCLLIKAAPAAAPQPQATAPAP